jgi:Ca2+-binding RTX toxin-like protein
MIDSGSDPLGLAVDSSHVYWTNHTTGNIARADLGSWDVGPTNINRALIRGNPGPWGLAVDDTHIYWANYRNDTIGRANLDGSGLDYNFIVNATPGSNSEDPASSPDFGPTGVAVDDRHVYWTNTPSSPGAATIGRAFLPDPNDPNGVPTNIEPSFIPLPDQVPEGLAVDSTSVYWTNSAFRPSPSIGRADKIDGDGFNPNFLTGVIDPRGVAVDDTHVYWTNYSTNWIGRADLIAGVNNTWHQTGEHPVPLAIGPAPPGAPGDIAASFVCAGDVPTVVGTNEPDKLTGTNGDDVIAGGGGDDTVTGLGGDDRICATPGADVIQGGGGDDVVRAGPGDDRVTGGRGDDELRGKGGEDTLRGGRGDDLHRGGGGDDRLSGGAGDDVHHGGGGEDRLSGGPGDDVHHGGAGDDRLSGGAGDDIHHGGGGGDMLRGGAGDDVHRGGGGEDDCRGGRGSDRRNHC